MKHPETQQRWFSRFAMTTAEKMGSPRAFLGALAVIVCWSLIGPMMGFSNTWQLWINTGTTIVTFLMVFVVQYTQNRDARAMHLKLDELLRAVKGAHTEMAGLKDLSDEELTRLEEAFGRLARHAQQMRAAGVAKDVDDDVEVAEEIGTMPHRLETTAARIQKKTTKR